MAKSFIRMCVRPAVLLVAGAVAMAVASSALAEAKPTGKDLFEDHCALCHTIKASDVTGAAPPLGGVAGRKVASAPKWKYSPALKAFGGKWDDARLTAFISNPQKTVPGTLMGPNDLTPAERAAVIKHLKTLKP